MRPYAFLDVHKGHEEVLFSLSLSCFLSRWLCRVCGVCKSAREGGGGIQTVLQWVVVITYVGSGQRVLCCCVCSLQYGQGSRSLVNRAECRAVAAVLQKFLALGTVACHQCVVITFYSAQRDLIAASILWA